ncbi:hypothetical protein FB45DRAFT_761226 [Roridomyces roridus]|uniref:Fido domain-containing protein n=1 Tax=Roridomyces roridus TaxID=1738132 RepID=A0AAD7B612_9AGAR|nr:hypothetical protein FB45DRAFT_761226 [Roridomyces roridus]
MSASTTRLARLFTVEYVKRINAQIVSPQTSVVVKPDELASALARPIHVSAYEPDRPPAYLAATLSYGIIKGHPFMDGNKRTAFFIGNQYARALGLSGLGDERASDFVADLTQRHIDVAAGRMDIEGLAGVST